MHLCVVCPTLAVGGSERLSVNLVNFYVSQGFQVDIVVFNSNGIQADAVSKQVRVVDLASKRARYAVLKLAKYLRSEKPEIVISMLREASIALGLASFVKKRVTKVIIREAAGILLLDPKFSFFQSIKLTIMRLGFAAADGLIVNSHDTLVSLTRINLVPKELPVSVIGNPVLTENYPVELQTKVTHKWLENQSLKVIISAGRLDPMKDFSTLIAAFALVRQKYAHAKLLILGEGQERKRLEKMIESEGLGDAVDMPGAVPNVLPYFKKSSIFVLSSISEGFGNVVVEALISGIPVIATRSGGPDEILKNGKFGILVDPRDPKQLADNICEVLQKPKKKTSGAMKRATDFTVQKIAGEYLNFAKSLR